jgi:hypothetical protein
MNFVRGLAVCDKVAGGLGLSMPVDKKRGALYLERAPLETSANDVDLDETIVLVHLFFQEIDGPVQVVGVVVADSVIGLLVQRFGHLLHFLQS